MINLFISSDETEWENGPAFWDKDRSLTEYILPDLKDAYSALTENNIEELKKIPCIFTYEKVHKKDAYIGRICDITVRQSNIRIDYELTGEIIKFEDFMGLSDLLDLGTWELNRTHWTLKKVGLSDLKPYYSDITAVKPCVFVSYSWTPISNQETVFELVSKLRQDNINVIYDKDDLYPGQNINYFMEQALERNDIDNIIVICNKDYAEKANSRQGGVGYEAGLIISEIRSAPLQRRVIPIAVEFDENNQPYLPKAFTELFCIDLTKESGYCELVSTIKKYKQEAHHA